MYVYCIIKTGLSRAVKNSNSRTINNWRIDCDLGLPNLDLVYDFHT